LPEKLYNPLLCRIVDQLSILSQLELELRSIQEDELPKGKVIVRQNTLELIYEIQSLHKILIIRFAETNTLEHYGKLFWTSIG
jgi:hypothetical protein